MPTLLLAQSAVTAELVHDVEYCILEAQNGKVWAVEDGKLDQEIAELCERDGALPNIIHYM